MELTHFDEAGNARMVDVSEKAVTSRTAWRKATSWLMKKYMNALRPVR